MFGLFKKKNSPNRPDDNQPPIPGPETDEFVLVGQGNDPPTPARENNPPPGNQGYIYPPIAVPPGPHVIPSLPKREVNFLQGVPFKLSKEFNGDSSNEMIAIQISEIMAHCTQKARNDYMNYNFNVERSVLNES